MKKILIIEDDHLVANIYRNKFSSSHFQAEIAHDGEAGLDRMRSFLPDVVLLDLVLPKMTGVEVLKKIRSLPSFERLPVIVFSNTYLSNVVQDAWKAGATKCLSKANCTPKQVIEAVRGLLAGQGDEPASSASATGQAAGEASPSGPGSSAATDTEDAAFQAEIRAALIDSFVPALATLRSQLQALFKLGEEAHRTNRLHELYRRIHALTANASLAGLFQIAQMTDALEALLKELYEKPRNVNPSTLRTVTLAIDFLGALFDRAAQSAGPQPQEPLQASILVVEDEAISRRAIIYALEKAKLQPTTLDDPFAALILLGEKKFDLIFLDVDMPGMNGFELCAKLRALPTHKDTPVIFVTHLSDFESRATSTVSGGNDLIAKPFLFIELTVKTLIWLLRRQMQAPSS
jgi:DNA-binding response OmpR family regulator